MTVRIETYTGRNIAPYIDDLARLRIQVFRDFPYLYDGEMAYEADYIATYANSPDSLFVLAVDGGRVVGASTGIPMRDETAEFKTPFIEQDYDPEVIFYFGESVLLPAYRGTGLGVRFFEEREAYARQSGEFTTCCFCAVERPKDHPLRPADYQPLDAFWNKRGFFHKPELRTFYSWRDVGAAEETNKPMSFWVKDLR
ncbi:MAG: GNAT family N-acetyltransferase [Brucellaceae bacterium]|jgi:GNAT superfamily N-acetyltransferase|nr:GNAT family N-acetyltransferase [Brucellaceae bacterium]